MNTICDQLLDDVSDHEATMRLLHGYVARKNYRTQDISSLEPYNDDTGFECR